MNRFYSVAVVSELTGASRLFAGLGAILIGSVVGCGDGGPELARVKGKVTVDGTPLRAATLTFVPESGSTSYGMTDANGEYDLMFTDTKYGAQLGKHTVSIETTKVSKGELEELKAQGLEVTVSNLEVPKQYKKQGALTAEVVKGRNTVNFELDSKAAPESSKK